MTRVLVVGLLLPSFVACSPTADELLCEQAAAHLAECCPGFDVSTLDCVEHFTQAPLIDFDESECVTRKDCASLQRDKICDWASKEPAAPPPEALCR